MLLSYAYLYIWCEYVQMYADVYGGQKRASGPLELEFQVVLSCQCGCWDLNSGSFLEVLGF